MYSNRVIESFLEEKSVDKATCPHVVGSRLSQLQPKVLKFKDGLFNLLICMECQNIAIYSSHGDSRYYLVPLSILKETNQGARLIRSHLRRISKCNPIALRRSILRVQNIIVYLLISDIILNLAVIVGVERCAQSTDHH